MSLQKYSNIYIIWNGGETEPIMEFINYEQTSLHHPQFHITEIRKLNPTIMTECRFSTTFKICYTFLATKIMNF
jgi:hypothetical protein